jgi:thiamine biosynthesis lipoprotein
VDCAAELLTGEYAINAGGDIRTKGTWRIGIQHPFERQAVAKVLEGADLAVATSGAYERGEHVLDPHAGAPPSGILSVTVTGPELGTADAYATAAFAMGGHRAGNWTARLRGYEAMTILADGRVLLTPGFPQAPSESSGD